MPFEIDPKAVEMLGKLAAFVLFGGGCGTVVFAIIHYIENLKDGDLSSNVKFWGAQALSIIVPFAAYIADRLAEQKPVQLSGVFLAALVAYKTAVSIHRVEEHAEERAED